jgi:hypothetical protein
MAERYSRTPEVVVVQQAGGGKVRQSIWLTFLVSLLLAACSVGQAQIVVEADHFDFGELVNGVVVTKELVVQNRGEAPLEIREISTSCGCTKAAVDQLSIAPGGSAILTIEYDSGAHGPELTGAITRQVFLLSNDPERPELIIEFDSLILPPESS